MFTKVTTFTTTMWVVYRVHHAIPRTVGRTPRQRFAPALPSWTQACALSYQLHRWLHGTLQNFTHFAGTQTQGDIGYHHEQRSGRKYQRNVPAGHLTGFISTA